MNQITIEDDSLAIRLECSAPETEIVNASGKVIGTFLPKNPIPQPPYGIKSPYTVEQLDEFEKQPGGKSLAEIWESLGRK